MNPNPIERSLKLDMGEDCVLFVMVEGMTLAASEGSSQHRSCELNHCEEDKGEVLEVEEVMIKLGIAP